MRLFVDVLIFFIRNLFVANNKKINKQIINNNKKKIHKLNSHTFVKCYTFVYLTNNKKKEEKKNI